MARSTSLSPACASFWRCGETSRMATGACWYIGANRGSTEAYTGVSSTIGDGWSGLSGGDMMRVPIIVCLCGSTRFSEAFHEANLRETLVGKIVLSIGCDFKSDTDLLLAGQLTPEDHAPLGAGGQ